MTLHAAAMHAPPRDLVQALARLGITLDSAPRPWSPAGPVGPAAAITTHAHLLWLAGSPAEARPWLQGMRRLASAPVLVVSGPCPAAQLGQAVAAGAALHLVRPVTAEQVRLALAQACRAREDGDPGRPDRSATSAWLLLTASAILVSPRRTLIALAPPELALLQALIAASGQPVDPGIETPERHAALYRLQRRIERESLGLRALRQAPPGRWALDIAIEVRPD